MAKWINRYLDHDAYAAEEIARNSLGTTVSLVTSDSSVHYDKGSVTPPAPDYNPLNLPAYTIRVEYKSGTTPSMSKSGLTKTQVSISPNIWDITYENTSWLGLFDSQTNLIRVLGAESSQVISMGGMYYGCISLTSVAIHDTSSCQNFQGIFQNCSTLEDIPAFPTGNVTTMAQAFQKCSALETIPVLDTSSVTTISSICEGCTSLKTVPLFDVSSMTNVWKAFKGATNVQSGALALYQRLAARKSYLTSYSQAFTNCGKDTVTGAAELAKIPSDWGGTMA